MKTFFKVLIFIPLTLCAVVYGWFTGVLSGGAGLFGVDTPITDYLFVYGVFFADAFCLFVLSIENAKQRSTIHTIYRISYL